MTRDDKKPKPPPFAWMPTAVFGDRRLTRTDVCVFGTIAGHANRETGLAWPSAARIAAMTAIDLRHVRKSIRRLSEFGWLEIERRKQDNGRDRSNRYRLNMVQSEGGGNCHPTRAESATPEDGGICHPEHLTKNTPPNISLLTRGAAHDSVRRTHAILREIEMSLSRRECDPLEAEDYVWGIANEATKDENPELAQHAYKVLALASDAVVDAARGLASGSVL